MLSYVSISVTKHQDQEQPGEKRAYLAYRLQSIIRRSHNRNRRGGHEECCSLVCSHGALSLLFYTSQNHWLRGGSTHHVMSVINQGMEAFLQLRLSDDSCLCQVGHGEPNRHMHPALRSQNSVALSRWHLLPSMCSQFCELLRAEPMLVHEAYNVPGTLWH